jgi:hypothetical protein
MMRKFSISVACISLGIFFLCSLSVNVYSSLECFGWSLCDDDPARHCATRNEFLAQIFVSSICDRNSCITRYDIHCEDMDADENDPNPVYIRRVTCTAYDTYGCDVTNPE